MKQISERLIGALLAILIIVSMAPVGTLTASATNAATQSTYTTGSIINYGSYPQTRVTDSGLIAALNAQPLGANSTVSYNGERYKRVYFTTITNSDQGTNGYGINTVYWFKFEPIQWRVLSNTGGELFVMAEKILGSRPYNQVNTSVTWETCPLRSWLNNEFYGEAFNATEQAKIKTSTVINENNPWHGTNGGNNTNDKLFLLSYSEVTNPAYGFSSSHSNQDTARRAQGSDFAKSNGLLVSTDSSYLGNSTWWLRTSGNYQRNACYVRTDGSVNNNYGNVGHAYIGVRPALKLHLTSDIFTSPSPTSTRGFPYNNQVYNKDIATKCAEIMTNYSVNTVVNKGFKKVTPVPSVPGDINGIGFLVAQKVYANDTLVLVAIEGTDGAQWQGNMDITGPGYNASAREHSSFVNGKNIVKNRLLTYLSGISGNTVLLITGHSRGAAVANLLAKDMTDLGKKVFAYTFATPNTSLDAPGNYPNIFNFCFTDDFVCQSPLSKWNYGKYGRTYWVTAHDIYANKLNSGFRNEMVKAKTTGFNKSMVNSFVAYMDTVNPTRWTYYNLPLPEFFIPIYPITTHFLLKDSIAPLLSNSWKIAQGIPLTLKAFENEGAIPILTFFAVGAKTYINSTHQPNTYLQVIKYDLFFSTKAQTSAQNSFETGLSGAFVSNPNASEIQALRSFAEIGDNAEKLGWDLNDIATWTGVSWTDEAENKIQTISIAGLFLTGVLDISGFSSLVSLNAAVNKLESVDVSGCISLKDVEVSHNLLDELSLADNTGITNLNCSWNQLLSLDVSACENLIELNCENNLLATLDLSEEDALERLYCANNELTQLNLLAFGTLEAVDCSLNYLDIQPGSGLMTSLEAIQSKDIGWVNYSPQKIVQSVAFNQDELNKMETFANTNDNQQLLGWDLLDPASWPGCVWVQSGNEYRLQSLDISALGLTGMLDLSNFTSLVDLNCDDNELESLDVSGCTSLQYLFVSNAGLKFLNTTGCEALLNVRCDRNYLDVSEGAPLRGVLDSLLASENIAVFEPQYIDAPADDFHAGEYDALTTFAQTEVNEDILDWDLNKPGEWSGVKWEEVNGEYRAAQIDVSITDLTGDLVLTSFEHLSSVRGAGSSISSLTLPDTLNAIEDRAFVGCNNLISVTVPQATQAIGTNAFAYCDNLETVTLGEATADVGVGAFLGCDKLLSVTVPPDNANFKVNDGVLFSKDGTRLVYYPPAQSITEYTIPDNVTSLQEGAFMDSNNLVRVTLGKGLTTVKQAAFSRCGNLEEVVLPNGLTDIEAYAFAYCPKLKHVFIPESVTAIQEFALFCCMGLESVTVDKALTNIGEHAFAHFEDEYLPLPLLTVRCFDGSAAHSYALENDISVYTFKLSFPQNSTAKLNLRNGYIYGLAPGLTSLDGYIEPEDGYSFEYIPTGSSCGTGTTVNVRSSAKSGDILESYTIILYGDVNGDGQIDANDAGIMQDYENWCFEWDTIDDAAFLMAADVNGDGIIGAIDADILVDVENWLMTIDQTTGLAAPVVDDVEFPESAHPYSNNMDQTWHYTHPRSAASLSITFSQETEVESG